MTRNLGTFVFFLFFALVSVSHALAQKAYPVDEGDSDPSFAAFRAKLIAAVVARDVDGVVSAAAKNVKLSFGGHAGRKDFQDLLAVSEADFSDEYKHKAAEQREGYWDSLEDVLRMGGRFTKPGTFEAPYTWTIDTGPDLDPFRTYFVIGKDVALRDRANKHGNVVAMLDHDIVTLLEGGDGTRFRKVETADNVSGFVHDESLRSAVDYRAIFKKRAGRWQIDVFIAGD